MGLVEEVAHLPVSQERVVVSAVEAATGRSAGSEEPSSRRDGRPGGRGWRCCEVGVRWDRGWGGIGWGSSLGE